MSCITNKYDRREQYVMMASQSLNWMWKKVSEEILLRRWRGPGDLLYMTV